MVFMHDDEEILFKREITSKGSSDYFIDDKSISYEEYDQRLRGFGILVKARNFLVFQVNNCY